MSGKVSGLVLDHLPGNDHVRLVIALVLADAADHDGTNVRPSVARVARLARVAERTVQYHLRQFEAVGFVVLVRPGGGRGRPAEYRINLDWLRSQPEIFSLSTKGASDAPFVETVQKGCTDQAGNGAKRVQPEVHPTPDPVLLPTTPTYHQVGAEEEIDQLLDAAVWATTATIKSESAYRAKIRARLVEHGPTQEDCRALIAWRKYQEKELAVAEAQEREQHDAKLKQTQRAAKAAAAESFLTSLDAKSRAEIERQFQEWLIAKKNSQVLNALGRTGIIGSPIVFSEFLEFLSTLHHPQPEETAA